MIAPETVSAIAGIRLRIGPGIGASANGLDRRWQATDTCPPMAPRISLAGVERIDELRPLWLQLHHHHARVSRVQPFVDDETSWDVRRRGYIEILGDGGFVLIAEADDAPAAGYALVKIHAGGDDSWALEDRWGEVWTLVVDDRRRGQGIGSALLDAVDAELASRG